MSAPETPSQTIGPFFHEGLGWAVRRRSDDLQEGEWLVAGSVLDGNGEAVPDAMVEVLLLQAPARFHRLFTDAGGRFAFAVRCDRDPDHAIAYVTIFARGLLGALWTRFYPAATLDALRARPELADVPPERLATLLPASADASRRTLEWSIHLQGDRETVFFDLA
jgi:protocatechuate 3,4-dioxygenase, alpha subunit